MLYKVENNIVNARKRITPVYLQTVVAKLKTVDR